MFVKRNGGRNIAPAMKRKRIEGAQSGMLPSTTSLSVTLLR